MPEVMTLKICHVFAGVDGGRWVVEQVTALRDRHGCDVTVVLGGAEGPTVDLCRAAGIRVETADFRMGGWQAFFTMPWRMLKLAWWMRRERFDVVQSHVLQSTFVARPAAWLADVPVRIEMVTGPLYMQALSSRWMEAATAFMETGIVPSCALTGTLYREAGIDSKRIQRTLYYGPPADRFDPARTAPAGIREELGLAPGTPLIASVAVFYPRCQANGFFPSNTHNRFVKGHTDIIRAMHAVLAAFPEAKLLLIGRGWGAEGEATERELEQFVCDEGLAGKVHFLGWRTDCARIYVEVDVSVQASLNDNLGGTVESLLMACPTVATRVGGMVDSVLDGKTGLLANPGDPDDLGRAILAMLRNPVEARQMAQAGREWMLERFTLEITVPGLLEIYRTQRAAVRRAWRLSASARRLFLAGWLLFAVLARAMLFDFYVQLILPSTIDRVKHRARRIASRLTPSRLAQRA